MEDVLFFFLVAAISIAAACVIPEYFQRRLRNLPPGPPSWPILGNIPQIGSLPHRSLARLAERYGPVMMIWLGSVPSVIVSSHEVAREVFTTQDAVFASRPKVAEVMRIACNYDDLIFCPTNESWKLKKKLTVQHLTSPKQVAAWAAKRQQEAEAMASAIADTVTSTEASPGAGAEVNLRQFLNFAMFNMLLPMLLGRSYPYGPEPKTEEERRRRAGSMAGQPLASGVDGQFRSLWEERDYLQDVIRRTYECVAGVNVADFLPWLAPVDPQRVLAKARANRPRINRYTESAIELRREVLRARGRERGAGAGTGDAGTGTTTGTGAGTGTRAGIGAGTGAGSGEETGAPPGVTVPAEEWCFADFLLQHEGAGEGEGEGEGLLSPAQITHVLQDMYVAGTDSATKYAEWALAELLNHPEWMRRVREEVDAAYEEAEGRGAGAEGGAAAESAAAVLDLTKLPVLEAVVREANRLHSGSLLIPHMTTRDTTLAGFHIPRHTMVQVNTLAIALDPALWPHPETFDPSRFLSPADSEGPTGADTKPIFFGAGRRSCPGAALGVDMLMRAVAALLRRVELRLRPGEAAVAMREKFEISPALEQPLCLVARVRRREHAPA